MPRPHPIDRPSGGHQSQARTVQVRTIVIPSIPLVEARARAGHGGILLLSPKPTVERFPAIKPLRREEVLSGGVLYEIRPKTVEFVLKAPILWTTSDSNRCKSREVMGQIRR